MKDIGCYLERLNDSIRNIDTDALEEVIQVLMNSRETGSTVYIFGNGGSASTASHCVCDYNKGISLKLDKKFNFVCLSDNVSTMMAIANDIGYDSIFRCQLEGKLKEGDVVFAISGSGNSKNVIEAVKYAKEKGNKIISLTGYDGGQLLKMSDYPIHVKVNDMQIVEDIHMMICHLTASVIAKRLGNPMC